MRAKLFSIGLASLCVGLARADYNPVPLTPDSFTQDIVVEKGAPPPLANFTTVTVEQGTNDYGNTFFEQGYLLSMPMLGLPPHGTTFTSRSNPNATFLMPPDYRTNNCAFIGSGTIPGTSSLQVQVPTATLNVVNPATTYSTLSILYAGGGNSTNVNVVVHHADGSAEAPQINPLDWGNGNTAYAWLAQGRIQVDGAAPLNSLLSASTARLFTLELGVGNGSPVTSVDFTWTTNAAGTSASNYRLLVFAVSGSSDGTTFSPIPVSGFNADAVIEAVGAPAAAYVPGTTVTFDGGVNNNSRTLYEQGYATTHYCDQGFNGGSGLGGTYNTTNGTYTGLPHPGAAIVSGTHNFVMPSTYAGNCCFFLANSAAGAITNGDYSSPNYKTATITLTSPQPLYGLSFFDSGTGGSGGTTVGYIVNYSDGTTQSNAVVVPDWFSGANQDFICQGRAYTVNPGLDSVGVANAGKLFHQDVALNNNSAAVTSITLLWTAGSRAFVFGLSAQTNSGGSYYPVPFSGFNADCIIEKEQVMFPGANFGATTATMDIGVRNGNYTWYEQGWVTNGIYVGLGLPRAGSTINSLLDPTRHYQLPASYSANNAILIDGQHTNVYITPATPASYSAFALLTAGASIGNGNKMYNQCILFHADGSAETNTFIGYDWFETHVSPAYIAHARTDTRYSVGASLSLSGTQTPELFESFFQVNNTGSAVTNILITDTNAPTSNSTTYVLAVSATAGAVQPVLGTVTQIGGSTAVNMEGSNVVFLCTSETGTAPLKNQWQFSADGGVTWSDLVDGGTFSGATTLGLTNSSLSWSNAGLYRLVATNAAGFAISPTVSLGPIYSLLPDVTRPGDPIVAFQPNGGSSPAAEGPANAIENLVGTNRDGKYLNYGANSGAPFAGPVGLVVSPSLGKTAVSALRIYTANDHAERDPLDFGLEGSNDGGNTWVPIAGGPLTLPATRNGPGWGPSVPPNVFTQALQEVHFPNTAGFFSYRLSFTNANNNTTANSIQIGEVELLGALTPTSAVITRDVTPNVRVFAGASPTFSIQAYGYPGTVSYQWYKNNVAIPGATSASYTFNNVQTSDSGATFYCQASNAIPPAANSSTATLTVLPAPTAAYATNVIQDGPLAWFRLNEGPDDTTEGGNNGLVTFDLWGGHNGYYTNAFLQRPGYSAQDADPSVYFGKSAGSYIVTAGTPDSCVEGVTGLGFARTNASVAFSVEAWVMLDPALTPNAVFNAGLVTKGYGGGGEQFNLDCGGGSATACTFRFFIRDANGGTHGPTGTVGPEPGVWHHLVGVVDEANSNVLLYVDGLLNASATVWPTNGLLGTSVPMVIGARAQNASTNNNLHFYGNIDEVAIYNHALSSNQVMNHFLAAGVAPRFTAQPTSFMASEGGPATFTTSFYGSPTLQGQWYQSVDNGASFAPLAGQTGPTLTLMNVPASYSGYQYYLQVTNAYGVANSATVSLTVVAGAPQLQVNVPFQTVVYAGRTLTLSAQFYGTLPITYQWYKDGVPLANNSQVSGALSNVLTIVNVQTNDAGSYQLFAHNAQDGGNPAGSSQCAVLVQTSPGFNSSGLGWTIQTNANSGPRVISGNTLTLTDGNINEATSAFYGFPLYIGGFQASFTYQDVSGDGADGFAFVLQNDPRGPAALGGAGASLGYSGITPSVALAFNLYGPNIPGMALAVNGAGWRPYTPTSPVVITNGNPISASLRYDGSVLSVVLSDAAAQTSFRTNIAVNLPALLGTNTAYVGFTGGDGTTVSTQTIGNFTFLPLPTLTAQATGTNTVVLSWPASVGGYVLLQEAGLVPSSWVSSPAAVTQVGGQYQAVVPATGGAHFYRLMLVSGQL